MPTGRNPDHMTADECRDETAGSRCGWSDPVKHRHRSGVGGTRGWSGASAAGGGEAEREECGAG